MARSSGGVTRAAESHLYSYEFVASRAWVSLRVGAESADSFCQFGMVSSVEALEGG